MLKIGLVSCVKQKRAEPAPAELLYTSPLFVKARAYAMRCYDCWYILSAKYCLVNPSTTVEPYDETLEMKSTAERKRWVLRLFKQIQEKHEPAQSMLYFHAGILYRTSLMSLLKAAGYTCEAPLHGLGIGQQLKWYNEHDKDGTCHYQLRQSVRSDASRLLDSF